MNRAWITLLLTSVLAHRAFCSPLLNIHGTYLDQQHGIWILSSVYNPTSLNADWPTANTLHVEGPQLSAPELRRIDQLPTPRNVVFVLDDRSDLLLSAKNKMKRILPLAKDLFHPEDQLGVVSYGEGPPTTADGTPIRPASPTETSEVLLEPTTDRSGLMRALESYHEDGFEDYFAASVKKALTLLQRNTPNATAREAVIVLLYQQPKLARISQFDNLLIDEYQNRPPGTQIPIFVILTDPKMKAPIEFEQKLLKTGGALIRIASRKDEDFVRGMGSALNEWDQKQRYIYVECLSDHLAKLERPLTISGISPIPIKISPTASSRSARQLLHQTLEQQNQQCRSQLNALSQQLASAAENVSQGNEKKARHLLTKVKAHIAQTNLSIQHIRAALTELGESSLPADHLSTQLSTLIRQNKSLLKKTQNLALPSDSPAARSFYIHAIEDPAFSPALRAQFAFSLAKAGEAPEYHWNRGEQLVRSIQHPSLELKLDQAWALSLQQRYAEALQLVAPILSPSTPTPPPAQALFIKGLCLYQTGHRNQGATLIKKAAQQKAAYYTEFQQIVAPQPDKAPQEHALDKPHPSKRSVQQ